MQNTRKVTDDIIWVGCNDRRLAMFENIFPLQNGVSYNSYLVMDEKITLFDTVDSNATEQFIENMDYVLSGKSVDYLVIQHMEPDHCANIARLLRKFSEMKIVVNAKTVKMIEQFFHTVEAHRLVVVKEGDTLNTGKHTFTFVMAPMVHWPEVMVTYDAYEKVLFSAAAFGTYGAVNGNIFDDEVDFDKDWIHEARRYYANICGKYGVPVQGLLKKAAGLEIQVICPLHGPVWRSNLGYFIDKYDKWSKYEPEDKEVMIIYGSLYGHTEAAANALATKLAIKGLKKIKVYDVSKTHVSDLIAEIFRASHIVLASSTYNGGLYPPMENLLADMKALSVQNRTIAVMENGTWAPMAGRFMIKELEEMKNIHILDMKLSIKSALQNDREAELDAFAQQIVDAM